MCAVIMQLLSPVCSFQELNYTIMINDMNGSSITQIGPYHQFGTGVSMHSIISGLIRSQQYSLTVTVATATSVVTSDTHIFGQFNTIGCINYSCDCKED